MRIAYIGRHGQKNSNDDEGAVVDGLRKLGHEVDLYQESGPFKDRNPSYFLRYDFVLFNKWYGVGAMENLRSLGVKLVFWYWDLVDWPYDLTLEKRSYGRRRWMTDVIPLVNLGFCTDGDWVAQDQSNKFVWLPQGADQRNYGIWDRVTLGPEDTDIDILFAGSVRNCGTGRADFLERMIHRYGNRFKWVEGGYHGLELAKLVKRSKVVVCPDTPVTDRYWSNRVYLMASMGARLFHPKCEGLDDELGGTLPTYFSLDHLMSLIYTWKDDPAPEWATELRDIVYEKYTYFHRLKTLCRTVQERLL